MPPSSSNNDFAIVCYLHILFYFECPQNPSYISGTDGAFEVSDEDINIGISVQKGNDELKDAINGVLKDMTEDDYNKMMDEAISVQPLSES
nr:hypothetical protein [Blautia obeum]